MPFLAIVAIAAVVSAATNAVTQAATTGHINWGLNGVAGAALAGAAGGAVGASVGIAAQSLGTVTAGVFGGAAGGATAGAYGAGFQGATGNAVMKSAMLGAVSGAIGGGVGVYAGENGLSSFSGSMVGTGAGTTGGLTLGAAWGDEITWQSAGMAFSSAFAGTMASTALSSGWASVTEERTAGEACEGNGERLTDPQRDALKQQYAEKFKGIDWRKELVNAKWYSSRDEAVYSTVADVNPDSVRSNRELFTIVVETPGLDGMEYACMSVQRGMAHEAIGLQEYVASFNAARRSGAISASSRVSATVHTHGDFNGPTSTNFSDMKGDEGVARLVLHKDSYLGTPAGQLKMLNYLTGDVTMVGWLPFSKAYTYPSFGKME